MKAIIFFLVLGIASSYGQYSPEYKTYREKYPNAHRVRLLQETHIIIKLDKNNIRVFQENIEEDLYLDETATYSSKQSLNFSAFFELEEIEAASYTFEKNKYRESKVENFKEKDELNQSFYDDTKSLNFIYPNLKKGSKSKLKYSQKIKNPRFLSPFYFGDFQPVGNNKVIITADKDITFRFQEFNTENLDIVFSKKERKGKIVYTWELKNINEYEYEENAPTFKKILPHIVPIITSYKVDGEIVDLLGDTADLYQWYYSLVKDINQDVADEGLIQLVDELTANKENDLEKVRAIYYWTQKNIKYIAFEYALGGFIPREANKVFQKKYGDCKDNSSILYRMLEIAGLSGNLTWIGTRSIPYSYKDVPTPLVDNHMILSYFYEDNVYFLDATGRFTPLEFPSSFIQGKEALVAINEGEFQIEQVPVVSAEKNALTDQTTIEIVNGMVVGRSITEISGYKKIDYLYGLENENTSEKIQQFYNAKLRKGNNKFLIDEIVETNKEDYDKSLKVTYNFTIGNHSKQLGDEIFINLNLNKKLSDYRTQSDRKHEIEYDYKSAYNYKTTLTIPEEYVLEYLPENQEYKNDYISSKITFDHKDNQITYTHSLLLDFINLDLAQQKEVNALIKKVEKGYKEIIILKKKT